MPDFMDDLNQLCKHAYTPTAKVPAKTPIVVCSKCKGALTAEDICRILPLADKLLERAGRRYVREMVAKGEKPSIGDFIRAVLKDE